MNTDGLNVYCLGVKTVMIPFILSFFFFLIMLITELWNTLLVLRLVVKPEANFFLILFLFFQAVV